MCWSASATSPRANLVPTKKVLGHARRLCLPLSLAANAAFGSDQGAAVHSVTNGGRPVLKRARENPFVAKAPTPVVAPTPAVVQPAALPVIEAPRNDPPPYQFLMRYGDDEGDPKVYLTRGADILQASAGLQLDNTYRVLRIEANGVVILNTESKTEHVIRIPAAP